MNISSEEYKLKCHGQYYTITRMDKIKKTRVFTHGTTGTLSCIAGGNINWFNYFWEKVIYKIDIHIPYVQKLLLMGIYSTEMSNKRHVQEYSQQLYS